MAAVVLLLWRPFQQAWIAEGHRADFVLCIYDFSNPLAGYPVVNREKRAEIEGGVLSARPFDADGVPVVDYSWLRWPGWPRACFYNSITVSQYALWGYFHPDYRTPYDRDQYLKMAEWLLKNMREDGAYENRFPHVSYGVAAGWVSGMGQGLAASVLVRAHLMTGEPRYLDGAMKAIRPLFKTFAAGGAQSVDGEGVWLEEVPEEEPSHILNGLIFAWWGLWDVATVVDDPEVKDLRDSVADTLRRNIWNYDSPEGARYELKRTHVVNTGHYLPLQVLQLDAMRLMTGVREFGEVADKWRAQLIRLPRLSHTARLIKALRRALSYRKQQILRWKNRISNRT